VVAVSLDEIVHAEDDFQNRERQQAGPGLWMAENS
jgi:hypothetical protein